MYIDTSDVCHVFFVVCMCICVYVSMGVRVSRELFIALKCVCVNGSVKYNTVRWRESVKYNLVCWCMCMTVWSLLMDEFVCIIM